jgi:hypothetical protein
MVTINVSAILDVLGFVAIGFIVFLGLVVLINWALSLIPGFPGND